MNNLFAHMHENDAIGDHPSIAPEKLLRAMLLQVLHSIRSERQLMGLTQHNLPLRWLIGLSMDGSVWWIPTVFTKNRERLIEHDAMVAFFNEALKQADKKKCLPKEHFSMDAPLIQAWADNKSFVHKDGKDDGGDFRSNETHKSRTAPPDSRLFRKGKTARELSFMGHSLTKNRNGLIAKAMAANARQTNPDGEITLGADKGDDATELIEDLQGMTVTPHVAQNKSNRASAATDKIANTEGYSISIQKRKLIDPIRQVMARGIMKVDQVFMMTIAAYNLVRTPTLGKVRLGRSRNEGQTSQNNTKSARILVIQHRSQPASSKNSSSGHEQGCRHWVFPQPAKKQTNRPTLYIHSLSIATSQRIHQTS